MRIIIAFVLLLTGSINARDFHIVSDVPYCTGGGKPLLMDVFIPAHRIRKPTPAVLWLHGGGWEQGNKDSSTGAELLAGQGFVAASISYRLSGDAPFPANIEDCKCAVRYLRANAAKYGIDPAHIGVAGASAGGQLAMLAGTAAEDAGLEGNGGWPGVSSRVQAVSSWSGATDFTVGEMEFGHHTGRAVVKLFGGTFEQKASEYRRASPITYVSADDPPLLIVQGQNDDVVPYGQAFRMRQSYEAMGLTVELISVQNAGHNFEQIGTAPVSPSVPEIERRTIEFFKRQLLR
jgi:acetyl esterase/lipase